MKNMTIPIILLFFCLTMTGCVSSEGKISDVKVTIGASEKFSDEEIQSAIDVVKQKFKDFEGCNLEKLWYDEEESNKQIKYYLGNGNGSVNGAKAENIIVLFSDLYADSSAGDDGFNPTSTYNNWSWVLIRDSKTSTWTVDDWGY